MSEHTTSRQRELFFQRHKNGETYAEIAKQMRSHVNVYAIGAVANGMEKVHKASIVESHMAC